MYKIIGLMMIGAMLAAAPLHNTNAQTLIGSDGAEAEAGDLSRVVSIGSAVTETIFALGGQEALVAVDESSTYPADGVEGLTKVSFSRNLSAEGVLSTNPSFIISIGSAGPESAIRQIRSTGTPMLLVTAGETPQDALERITQIGKVFHLESEADALKTQIEADLAKAEKLRNSLAEKPSVMFIYARGQNNLMVSGTHTSANTMIELAGGENVFTEFNGYKPLTAEAVVQANPDVILMMDSGLASIGGKTGVLSSPGVEYTNAAKNDRIYSMEGVYLLGFGPRLGTAVLDVMNIFHPDLNLAELK